MNLLLLQGFQVVAEQSDAHALLKFLGCFEDTYRKWLALNHSLLDCVRKLFRKFGGFQAEPQFQLAIVDCTVDLFEPIPDDSSKYLLSLLLLSYFLLSYFLLFYFLRYWDFASSSKYAADITAFVSNASSSNMFQQSESPSQLILQNCVQQLSHLMQNDIAIQTTEKQMSELIYCMATCGRYDLQLSISELLLRLRTASDNPAAAGTWFVRGLHDSTHVRRMIRAFQTLPLSCIKVTLPVVPLHMYIVCRLVQASSSR